MLVSPALQRGESSKKGYPEPHRGGPDKVPGLGVLYIQKRLYGKMMTQFSWDERKSGANRRKHGVSFETATLVFADPHVIFAQDREVNGEPRWQAIGRVAEQVLLLVAHAYEEDDGEETIRIISARRATTEEREAYLRQFRPSGCER